MAVKTVDTVKSNGISDGNLATTYALIYSFLTSRSHDKAAVAVKKAAKDIIVLKDELSREDAALDEIVKWWRSRKKADVKNESSSDSDSDTSSDSESSDSSSDDSSDSDASSSSSSSSSDSSDSSSSSGSDAAKPRLDASKAAKAMVANGSGNAPKKAKNSKPTEAIDTKDTKDSSSSNSSSDSDSDSSSPGQMTKPSKTLLTKTDAPNVGTTVISVITTKSADARAAKRRRTSDSGNAIVTAVAESSPLPKHNGQANGKKPRKSNAPFQRIKADTVEFHDERLKDNTFTAKGGTANDYGARANQDLIVTRGDGFRKEKNKKKRGSYRGGEITLQSHSIKFT